MGSVAHGLSSDLLDSWSAVLGRHKDSGRRIAGGLSLLLMLFLLQLVMAFPASAAPSFTVSPVYGEPGSAVRVSGSGYLPTVGQVLRVNLCWDRSDGCADLGTAGVGAAGDFIRSVTIPAEAEPGFHRIYACQGSDCASDEFEVLGTAPPPTTTTTVIPTTSSTPASTPTSTQMTTTTSVAGTTSTPSQITTSSTQPGASPIGGAEGIPSPSSPPDEVAVVSITSGTEAATRPQALSVIPSFSLQPSNEYVSPKTGGPGTAEVSPETATAAVEGAGEDSNGFWSLRTPAVLWVVWLGVVLVSSLMISLLIWLGGKMRTSRM